MLVLASSSPYRRELLERLRVPFSVSRPDVDERPLARESPRETAIRLAQAKARAVAISSGGTLIVGSDQVASLHGLPIGKPGNREAALGQLRAMRGHAVTFHTALCLFEVSTGRSDIDEVPTTVQFRQFSDEQAERYLDIDQPYDCAGSARIEALGIALVERVESSDPTALIGLPLIALVGMLKRAGLDIP